MGVNKKTTKTIAKNENTPEDKRAVVEWNADLSDFGIKVIQMQQETDNVAVDLLQEWCP